MVGYIQEIIEEFPYEIKRKVPTPAAPNLFDTNRSGNQFWIRGGKSFSSHRG